MKIILLNKIEKLGNSGSEVFVKSGYARNFLIPQSQAILATKKNIEVFKEKKRESYLSISDKRIQAEFSAKAISDIKNITIKARSNIEGKLFGSVGPRIIAKVITESIGFKILKSQIRLPNREILRSTGIYKIKVHIYDKVYSYLNVIIVNV